MIVGVFFHLLNARNYYHHHLQGQGLSIISIYLSIYISIFLSIYLSNYLNPSRQRKERKYSLFKKIGMYLYWKLGCLSKPSISHIKCKVYEKDFAHTLHLKDFSPVWSTICFFKWPLCEKDFSHNLHLNGWDMNNLFLTVFTLFNLILYQLNTLNNKIWQFTPLFKCNICEKSLSQKGHLKKHIIDHTEEKTSNVEYVRNLFHR